jgi:hypothetical protein
MEIAHSCGDGFCAGLTIAATFSAKPRSKNHYHARDADARRQELDMTPNLSEEQVIMVAGLVANYIEQQRAIYRPRAFAVPAEAQAALSTYFSAPVLQNVGVLVLQPPERVANPDFYPVLVALGFSNLPDQSAMNAITYNDTVVVHGVITQGLMFHELVHVEQYVRFGVATFSDLYVRGFLAGGGYAGIPLEQQAYALQARFEANPYSPFSVAAEVANFPA